MGFKIVAIRPLALEAKKPNDIPVPGFLSEVDGRKQVSSDVQDGYQSALGVLSRRRGGRLGGRGDKCDTETAGRMQAIAADRCGHALVRVSCVSATCLHAEQSHRLGMITWFSVCSFFLKVSWRPEYVVDSSIISET